MSNRNDKDFNRHWDSLVERAAAAQAQLRELTGHGVDAANAAEILDVQKRVDDLEVRMEALKAGRRKTRERGKAIRLSD